VCGALAHETSRHRISDKDLRTSFVDGDDLLALVNRSPTGALAADYVPKDLVELGSLAPKDGRACEATQCLRMPAATALKALLAAMSAKGFPGRVESAYRSYDNQCGTFLNWVKKGDFCGATEQSALPGHSQHQLGTTVDLFTEEWARDPRGVFREGFGCTPGGVWMREHAHEFGFVMSYPIHPDDEHSKQRCVTRWDIPIGINPKTGYRYEHWHFRYLGKENAAEFQAAYLASATKGAEAITLEQWLRGKLGLGPADAELPVCDGCNCGACATLTTDGKGPCKDNAVLMREGQAPSGAQELPEIAAVKVHKHGAHTVTLSVTIEVPQGTLTQPPIFGKLVTPYTETTSYLTLAPFVNTLPRAYAPLPSATRLAIEPVPRDANTTHWPYRYALAGQDPAPIYNRANVVLPVRAGTLRMEILIPRGATEIKLGLEHGGVVKESRSLRVGE
jgi:zinc D-Ala-D-Ala carboxypeptidase